MPHKFFRCVFPILFVAICVAPLLAACGPVMAVPPASAVDAPAGVAEDVYKLSPGDTIRLTVYDEETLTASYTIDSQGLISIPLAGEIPASGLTRAELQADITEALVAGDYLSDPSVTVDVATLRPFYILGEVKTPGSYPYQPSLNVLQAIATAGGYSPRAARGMVLIDRGEGANKQRLNAKENTQILPGDSITVRERIF